MTDNLPKKYEISFFNKIKRFFSNIFTKKNNVVEIKETIQKEIVENKAKELDKMKQLSNEAKIKEDILTLVKKNPELIKTMPIENLKELNRMCADIIEKNDREIKKLKREIA